MIAAAVASPWLAAALGLAALLGAAGAWRHGRGRARWLVLVQPLLAAALFGALVQHPPGTPGTLLVLSGGAAAPAWQGPAIALPAATPQEAGVVPRVPDLATALRQHPKVAALHVVGRGLEPHDREAIGARALTFDPAPAPSGPVFLALQPPTAVRAGAPWIVRGRVAGSGEVELLDPAGARVASVPAGDDGRFELQGLSRAIGPAEFRLRLRDGERVLAEAVLPVAAQAGRTLRVLLLAGVPSAEVKFLRRWAVAAGVELDARVALSPALQQQRGAPSLDAAALAQYDLVIADERSWPWLARQRGALLAAVDDGLGLLLRVTGPLPERVAAEWAEVGIRLRSAGDKPAPASLAAGEPALHAWPLAWAGEAASHPWRDVAGVPLAAWQPRQLGRVGATWLLDSFRLHTRGAPERHAALWSELVGQLARARDDASPGLLGAAMLGRRAVWCGLGSAARVVAPDATDVDLLTLDGCAAWWPRQPGWHRLLATPSPEAAGQLQWAYVPASEEAAARREVEDRERTLALATPRADPQPSNSAPEWRRWLPWLGVLALAALVWWLERRWRASEAPAPSAAPDAVR